MPGMLVRLAIVGMLCSASILGLAHAAEISVAGVYSLVEINGEMLPAAPWALEGGDSESVGEPRSEILWLCP